MMIEVIASIFLLAGSIFMLIASIGILRLPDLYIRMHAVTKAASLGMFLILVSLSITYFELSVVIKSILILIFIFLTVPVAAHLIAGTGHFLGVKKWSKTILDEWQEKDK